MCGEVYSTCGGCVWGVLCVLCVCGACSGAAGGLGAWSQEGGPPGLGKQRERQAAPAVGRRGPGGRHAGVCVRACVRACVGRGCRAELESSSAGWTPAIGHRGCPHPGLDLRHRSREEMLHGKAWQVPESVLHKDWEGHPAPTPARALLGFQETCERKRDGCGSHRAAGSGPAKQDLDLFGDPVFMPRWRGRERSLRVAPLLGVSPRMTTGCLVPLSPPPASTGQIPAPHYALMKDKSRMSDCKPLSASTPQRLSISQGCSVQTHGARPHGWFSCTILSSPHSPPDPLPFAAAHLCSFLTHLLARPQGLCTYCSFCLHFST